MKKMKEMKKITAMVIASTMIFSQVAFVSAAQLSPIIDAQTTALEQQDKAKAALPIYISGTITAQTEDTITVKSSDGEKTVVLKISPETFVLKAQDGSPMKISERKGDEITAFYGPIETRSLPPQSNAVAIICDIPADMMAPRYTVVEAVEKVGDDVRILVDGGGLYITLNKNTVVSPYLTKNIVTKEDVTVGSKILAFYQMVAMSYPGQTSASKVVLLNKAGVAQATPTQTPKPTDAPKASEDTKIKVVTIQDQTTFADPIAKGKLPQFADINNSISKARLDAIVKDVYDKAVKTAHEQNSKEITFSYEKFIAKNDITSLKIVTEINSGNTTSATVDTIVIDAKTYNIMKMEDFLGVNAYKLGDRVIAKTIEDSVITKYYNDENLFKGIKSEPMFYIDNSNNLVLIFDKYAIAPGTTGTPTFKIPLANFKQFSVYNDNTFMQDAAIVIPLRLVAEEFGFKVSWDEKNQTVTVAKGQIKSTVVIGVNNYDDAILVTAPVIKNGQTYVPMAYFEALLKLSYIQTSERVVFSSVN